MRKLVSGILLLALLSTVGCSKSEKPPPVSQAPALDISNERAISYMIEREENGKPVAAPDDYKFRSGDRFRLRFRPGFAAYIYVVNRSSHDTHYHVLFPAGSETARNPLQKGASAAVPIDAEWLRLDRTPGHEHLILIASSLALPQLEKSSEIERDRFEDEIDDIERLYQPTSISSIRDHNWTKFFAARKEDKDLVLITRIALRHE